MRQYEKPLFLGAASEIMTTFDEDGTINYDLMRNQIEFLLENKVTALFANGLASEVLTLEYDERIAIAKFVVEAVHNRVPVMINIAQNNIHTAVREAKEHENNGVDALVVTPPVVYKLTDEALYEHYVGIGRSVSLPMYIYNAPETGNKLSPVLAAKIFNENGNYHGYKDSTQNVIEQQTLLGLLEPDRPFELICGSDAQTATTMMTGGIGVISLLTVAFPKPVVDVCKAALRKDWETALALQSRVIRIREAMKIGPFLAAYKYACKRAGISLGVLRSFQEDLSAEQKRKIDTILAAENLL